MSQDAKKQRARSTWNSQTSPTLTSVLSDDKAAAPSSPGLTNLNHAYSSPEHTAVSSPARYQTSVFYNDASFYEEAVKVNEEMNAEITAFLSEYEDKMKKWETQGEWIEVRETLNGKIAWYNSLTTRLVFDTPPNTEILALNNPSNAHTFQDTKYYLNRNLAPLQNEDVVASLLSFDKDIWNFDYNNRRVYNYRLAASARDHSSMLPPPQQYVFPEYFSLAPLPELLANKFLAKIKLPSALSKNKKYSLVQIKNDITKASDVIKAGVSKLDPPHNKQENVGDFIIKIVGQEAYMYGKKHVIEYEAVRDALRNEDDVEFALIKRTDFKTKIEKAKKEQAAYCCEFKTAYDNILSQCQPTERRTLSGEDDNDNNDDEYRDNNNNNDLEKELASIDLPSKSISLYEFEWHYRLKIEGLTNVTSLPRYDASMIKSVYVLGEIWCGGQLLSAATLQTANCAAKPNIRWGKWLSSQSLLFSQLPRESTLCLMVYGNLGAVGNIGSNSNSMSRSIFGRRNANAVASEYNNRQNKPNAICLAWVRLTLITDEDKLRAGRILLNMWHLPASTSLDSFNQLQYEHKPFRYRGSLVHRNIKVLSAEQCQILIGFDEHPFDVIAPKYSTPSDTAQNRFNTGLSMRAIRNSIPLNGNKHNNNNINRKKEAKKEAADIESIILRSPLNRIEIWEKQLIWRRREDLWHRPEALAAFVRSCNWTNIVDIAEAHKYIKIWAQPKQYYDAIEFLDYKYMDTLLREKAVLWLSEMDDSDLQKYLLQLIQCLKFELHHTSWLSLFLIRRALISPYQIGHYFYWHLKSEYDEFIEIRERFGLYLEEYLLFCCGHQNELFVQHSLLSRLEWISKKVTAIPEKKRFQNDSKRFFRKELLKLNHDLPKNSAFQIPLYPRWRALNLKIDSCKYMSSKKVPLWLVFSNADELGSDIVVMYKYGDDLRQDMLTLQIISLMDLYWLNENVDLHLKPYKCLATGHHSGMLEIVLNSKTVNNIAESYGGVFNEKAIDNFIKQYNISPSFCISAKETFARSVAGYCIATYVLGVSDRHSSNYMVCKNGQFFHIDFGHFLGNWKTKWGIKRERTPLVFTNQMKYAISNDNEKLYKEFICWCSTSYNILRAKNRLLLILFRLMIAAGMQELVNENDIMYFQKALNLNLDNKAATKHIEKAIDKALKDWGTYVNNKFHQIRHQNKK